MNGNEKRERGWREEIAYDRNLPSGIKGNRGVRSEDARRGGATPTSNQQLQPLLILFDPTPQRDRCIMR